MNYTVVTSFSVDGYYKYGRNFIKTFMKYWPSNVQLTVYHEGITEILDKDHIRVDLLKEVHGCSDFINKHSDNEHANGRKQKEGTRWKHSAVKAGYNYRFDAVKFCRKVFAIEHAAKRLSGKLFWVDADVKTFNHVPISLLDRMLPDEAAISYLSRPRSYSECGFVGYNLDHPDCLPFISAFASSYKSGNVFHIPEWHDSFVFDWYRKRLGVPGYQIPSSVDKGHVFINSELGEFMDHLKGDRKNVGRSYSKEMVSNHSSSYWSK